MRLPSLAALLIVVSLSPARADLVLDELAVPQRWQTSGAARIGRPALLSGDGASASGLRMDLPLSGEGPRWLTLALTHSDWTGFSRLRIRAFAEEAFETPLELSLEDHAGHRLIAGTSVALGPPGWNECDVPLANIGQFDLAHIRSLSIGLQQPRAIDPVDSRHATFYLAEIRLLSADSTAAPMPAPASTRPSPVPTLRANLGVCFPQHLIVEKFRIAVATNAIVRLALPLSDEILFDPSARSNLVRSVESQAAALIPRTNLVGISFNITVPPITSDSPLKLAAFRSWLTNAYVTIGDLGSRWNSKLTSTAEVRWPAPQQTAPWRGAVSFWQQTVTETLRDCVQAARRGAPRAYLLSHLDRLTGAAWLERPLDYYSIQRTVGWSHYSLADGGGDSREFVGGGETRVLISTLAAQINRRLWADSFDWSAPEGRWLTSRGERWLAQVASRNLWLQMAAGKDGASVPMDVPQLTESLQQTAPLWPVFASTRRACPKLGVVCSSGSRLMNSSAAEVGERWFYENFWAAGYEPAVIFEETFRDYPKVLGDYNVLALGGATHLPNWLQDALLGWVERGGVLLCSGPPGLYDPWGRRLARLLWEVLGVDDAHQETSSGRRWRVDSTRLKTGCEIMASDETGQPLAIRAKHGRGEVVVSLVPFGQVKPLREYWRWKVAERVKRDIESQNPNLYLDWRATENRRTFFAVAVNLSPYAATRTRVTAYGQFSRVVNLCERGGAEPLPRESTDVATSFPLELPPGGGAVLMLEKAAARR